MLKIKIPKISIRISQKYWIFFGILILAFLAGNFVYPDYYNKSTDFLNQKFEEKKDTFWSDRAINNEDTARHESQF